MKTLSDLLPCVVLSAPFVHVSHVCLCPLSLILHCLWCLAAAVLPAEKLRDLEEKTGYPKVYFFLGGLLLISTFLTAVGGAKLIVDLVGFVYPAYMSFKSMDSGNQDDTQWLTYWVVFSCFSIVESFMGFVVAIIPFYFWIKIAAICYMWHPSTRGAQTIYEQFLRPIMLPYLDSDKATTKKSE